MWPLRRGEEIAASVAGLHTLACYSSTLPLDHHSYAV
jgi:hypothetical protein